MLTLFSFAKQSEYFFYARGDGDRERKLGYCRC